MYYLWYILLGLASGWIANLIVKGNGSQLIVNLIVGAVGGVLGGWLYSLFGLAPAGTLGSLATSVIGATALLWIAAALSHKKIRSTGESTTMETKKTDKTGAAEAENLETMDLLGGMLDNATRCGNSTDDVKPASEESGK